MVDLKTVPAPLIHELPQYFNISSGPTFSILPNLKGVRSYVNLLS